MAERGISAIRTNIRIVRDVSNLDLEGGTRGGGGEDSLHRLGRSKRGEEKKKWAKLGRENAFSRREVERAATYRPR